MALIARLVLRDNLWRCSSRLTGVISPSLRCLQRITTTTTKFSEEDFFAKNKRLNRPLSPHLTIYKLQITSMLSVTHRGTGLFLSTALYGFTFSVLTMSGNFAHCLEALQAAHYSPALIAAVKFMVAWPFLFHFANGVRHLAWDLGYGFELKQVYTTGYATLGISLILASIVSFM